MSNNQLTNFHSDYHRLEDELMHSAPPLDLSFKNANNIDELLNRSIKTSRVGKLPDKSDCGLYLTSSLWLSNNSFESAAKLEDLTKKFLENPSDLRWLDLSYNKLKTIDDDITIFKNLKILYLHGNDISDIRSIVKLRSLQNLRTLTLHGNQIEQMKDYRRYVIAILPWISNLDFSPVIDTEKKKALPTGFFKTIQLNL